MSKIVKVLDITDGVEANLLDKHLKEKNIPFHIVSNVNGVYDGIFKIQEGWGYIEAPEEFTEEIQKIYGDLLEGEQVDDPDNPPVIPDESKAKREKQKLTLARKIKTLSMLLAGLLFLAALYFFIDMLRK